MISNDPVGSGLMDVHEYFSVSNEGCVDKVGVTSCDMISYDMV